MTDELMLGIGLFGTVATTIWAGYLEWQRAEKNRAARTPQPATVKPRRVPATTTPAHST